MEIEMQQLSMSFDVFHQNIHDKNVEEIDNLIKAFPEEKLVCVNGNSAVAFALKCESFDVYETLVSNGFKLAPGESFEEIFTFLDENPNPSYEIMTLRIWLREIHKKYVIDSSLTYLYKLILKSKLTHSTHIDNRRKFDETIAEAFETLNKMKKLEQMLKFVASAKNLRIYFDFELETVEQMDPTKKNNVFGTTYPSKLCIYIGAKNLLDDEKRLKVIGTMAHEIGHLVNGVLYQNDCKPYKAGDELKLQKFNSILDICQENKEAEDIIAQVFEYPESKWHAELIVRVPHLLAVYQDDPDKFIKCQDTFSDLFEFFDEQVLPDLEEKLIEARDLAKEMQETHGVPMDYEDAIYFKNLDNQRRRYKIFGFLATFALIVACFASWFFWPAIIDPSRTAATRQIERINRETFSVLNDAKIILQSEHLKSFNLDVNANGKFIQYKSNCVFMTMIAIYQFLALSDSSNQNIFVNIKNLENETTFNEILEPFDSVIKPTMIINCEKENNITILRFLGKIEERKVKERIILITNAEVNLQNVTVEIKTILTKHSWLQLTERTQERLLITKANFQGEVIEFRKIIGRRSSAFKDDNLLNQIVSLESKIIKIGNEIKFDEHQVHIPRNFFHFGDSNCSVKSSDLIELALTYSTIVLSAEPGMGKTMEFKAFAMNLKRKFPANFVLFIDLKEYYRIYQKYESTNFTNSREVSDFFSQNILELKSEEFEEKIFIELFEADRVIFLFDGFDEITPNFTNFIMNLLKSIKRFRKNQIWISTRLHWKAKLVKELNATAFGLKPFTRDDQIGFLKKFIRKGENFEKVFKSTGEFLNSEIYESLSGNSISNPLLTRMIAETLKKNPSFDFNQLNLYKFYHQFIYLKLNEYKTKGPIADEEYNAFLIEGNFMNIHHRKALELMCKDHKKLVDFIFKNSTKVSNEQIIRVGITFSDDSGNFKFIHRNFAEYFEADFFYKIIFRHKFQSTEELDASTYLLTKSVGEQNIVLKFLNDALEDFFIYKNTNKSVQVKKSLEKALKLQPISFENEFPIFFTTLLHILADNDKKESFDLWTSSEFFDGKLLNVAAEKYSAKSVKKILKIANETFDPFQLRALMFQRNAFFRANNNFRVLENAASLNFHEVFEILLTFTMSLYSFEEFETLIIADESLVKELCVKTCEMCSKNINVIRRHLSQKSNKIYMELYAHSFLKDMIKCGKMLEVEQFLIILSKTMSSIDIRKIFQKRDNLGLSIFMHAAITNRGNAVETLWDFVENYFDIDACKRILLHKNKHGSGIFPFYAINLHHREFEALWSFIKKQFDRKTITEILFSKNKAGQTIFELDYLIFEEKYIKNKNKNFESLFTFLCNNNNNSTHNQEFTEIIKFFKFLNIENLERNIINSTTIFLLNAQTSNDENIFHFAAQNDFSVFYSTVRLAKKHLDRDLISKMLKAKTLAGKNIFDLYGDLKDITEFLEVMRGYFDETEIEQNLVKADDRNLTLLHHACLEAKYRELKNLLNLMNETLSLVKFRELVEVTTTKTHESALMFCSLNEDYENLFPLFWSFIEKKFNETERIEMLLQQNTLGFTSFDYAVLNRVPRNFDSFLNTFGEVVGKKKAKSFVTRLFNETKFFDQIKLKSEDNSTLLEFYDFVEELFDDRSFQEIILDLDDKRLKILNIKEDSTIISRLKLLSGAS